MKRIAIVLAFCVASMASSCNRKPESNPASSAKDSLRTDNEYTCPMHPEVVAGKPGDCPKCGMELHIKS